MRWKGENDTEFALLTRATAATEDSLKISLEKIEIWTSDSGAIGIVTPSTEGLPTIESEGLPTIESGGRE